MAVESPAAKIGIWPSLVAQVVFGFFGFCAALQAVGLYLVRYVPSSYQDGGPQSMISQEGACKAS